MATTIIVIPGREAQTINMTLTAEQVRDSYADQIDLRSFQVNEEVIGDTTRITFSNRTGTKGADTIIRIPGREQQVLPGMTLDVDTVKASYAGSIDLSSFQVQESTDAAGNKVIAFSNRTGTKGADTIIRIPGREQQVLPGMTLDVDTVKASYAGSIDLSSFQVQESTDAAGNKVIAFSNRTGTKGTDGSEAIMTLLAAAGILPGTTAQPEAPQVAEIQGGVLEENVEVANTLVKIPGREDQLLPGIVMDAAMLRNSYSGQIDLSQYDAEEVEQGNTLVVTFRNRAGTKGE